MKTKTKILAFISAIALSSVAVGFSASALNTTDNEKITLSNLSYNSETKTLDYTLTNNTDDKFVEYSSMHRIYKVENGKKTPVTPSYCSFLSANRLYPKDYIEDFKEVSSDRFLVNPPTSDTLTCATYKTEGVNFDEDYEFEHSALPSGKYTLEVTVDVYDYDKDKNTVITDPENGEKILYNNFDDEDGEKLTFEKEFIIP